MDHQQQTIIIGNTSAAWRLTSTVIIVKNINIMVKAKDNIVNYNRSTIIKKQTIKNQQDKFYINKADIIHGDIIKKIEYIMLTSKVKTVVKNWRLELIIQSKEFIKIDIKEEIYTEDQKNIMNKLHIHNTIK